MNCDTLNGLDRARQIPPLERESARLYLRRALSRIDIIFLGCVCFPSLLRLPLETTDPNLDNSWREAYLYFLKTGAQVGVDYSFTYGPLAYFIVPVYDPALYVLVTCVAIVLAVAATIPIVWLAARRGRVLTSLALAWIVANMVPFAGGSDTGYILAITALTILLFEGRRVYPVVFLLLGILFAFLSLMKFTLFAFCGMTIGFLVAHTLLSPVPRSGRWRQIGLLLGSFLVSLSVFWLLAGQHPLNFLAFLRRSLDISNAYNNGMHTPVMTVHVAIGIALFALLFLQLAMVLREKSNFRSGRLWIVAFAACVLLLTWKMGIVRAHTTKFFIPAAALTFFLPMPVVEGVWRRMAHVMLSCVILILATFAVFDMCGFVLPDHAWRAGLRVVSQTYNTARFLGRKKEFQARYEAFRRMYALPEIREIVGNDTIDIFNPNQSLILFNDLNYTPRPVFQGYQACTPDLQRWNGSFYESQTGPAYVLYLGIPTPVDGKAPTVEDSVAVNALLRKYRPVHREGHFFLLKRIPSEESKPLYDEGEKPANHASAKVNQWVELDDPGDDWQILTLHPKASFRGSLRSLLFQAPIIYMEIRHTNGETLKYRINTGTVQNGFIINPVLQRMEAMDDWPGISKTLRVSAFRVVIADGNDGLLRAEYDYSVSKVPPMASAP